MVTLPFSFQAIRIHCQPSSLSKGRTIKFSYRTRGRRVKLFPNKKNSCTAQTAEKTHEMGAMGKSAFYYSGPFLR